MTHDNSQHGPSPLDRDAVKRKYQLERDKRLRPDGNEQYVAITGQLGHYAADPYTPRMPRGAKNDHVTVAVIGGGFAGLLTGARLKEAGIEDVRILEKGGDFGGTWYWNRYPGAQCDTASLVYMPLLEETGHMPSEKYAHAPEILSHCQRIGRHFNLYERALFHTDVERVVWDEAQSLWRIVTRQGDDFTAQFVSIGTGSLNVPKLPAIPGLAHFEGHSFHTSRWDYDYTGGAPDGAPLARLGDKTVAVIGTGATAVQCVPHLAKAARKLYVCQRTPSSVDARNNHPIDAAWFASIAEPGWQQRWLENFTINQTAGPGTEDLVKDGWTDIANRIRSRIMAMPPEQMTPAGIAATWEDADFEKMAEVRKRVDTIVKDPDTADKLKAWYRQMCKRPCFHDSYLQAYNEPSTELLDTDGRGVERITRDGIVACGREYAVDCIVFASGFDTSLGQTHKMGFEVLGRSGRSLSSHWADGMRTLHGTHAHGFPNLFIVQPTQGAYLLSNIPHNLAESARTIAAVVQYAATHAHREVEVTQAAEQAWVELLLSGERRFDLRDCTPGYYNNEGQDGGQAVKHLVGYPMGPVAYFRYLKDWRSRGAFAGLAFR